jgi:hypothetical protein
MRQAPSRRLRAEAGQQRREFSCAGVENLLAPPFGQLAAPWAVLGAPLDHS